MPFSCGCDDVSRLFFYSHSVCHVEEQRCIAIHEATAMHPAFKGGDVCRVRGWHDVARFMGMMLIYPNSCRPL